MHLDWQWFLVGLLPYFLKRHQTKGEHVLTVKALLWRLTMRWKKGQCSWNLSLPWIEHGPR